jgi:hypothetical protein
MEFFQQLRRCDHDFGRNATPVQTGTPDFVLLDDGDLGAQLGGAYSRHIPSRSRAYDGYLCGHLALHITARLFNLNLSQNSSSMHSITMDQAFVKVMSKPRSAALRKTGSEPQSGVGSGIISLDLSNLLGIPAALCRVEISGGCASAFRQ